MSFTLSETADIAEFAAMEGLTFNFAVCVFLFRGHDFISALNLRTKASA